MKATAVDGILKLLERHRPADANETGCLLGIRELVTTASEPFSRQHFQPGHLTASAVVVNAQRSQTLLVFHSRLKLWLQPGGHFEPGETDPHAAAAREVLEETGLRTRWPGESPQLLDVDVHEIPARKNEPAHFHFDLRMLLVAEEGLAKAGDDGVVEARWFSLPEWQAMSLDPGLVRALRKIEFTD